MLSVRLMFIFFATVVLFSEGDDEEDDFDPANTDAFNPALAGAFTKEWYNLTLEGRLSYMNRIGQLAFYSRIYRMWVRELDTGRIYSRESLPMIRFRKKHVSACSASLTRCIDTLWNFTATRNSFIFGKGEDFDVEQSALVAVLDRQMFEYDFSTIYLMCWMTMNRVDAVKELPYCNIKPMDSFYFSLGQSFGSGREVKTWPKSTANSQPDGRPVGPIDTEEFHCASQSFCADLCFTTPGLLCDKGRGCNLKPWDNNNLAAMLTGSWNLSCDCYNDNKFTYTYDTFTCVDIDECVENEPCSENEQCVNTIGSYMCVCQYGYVRGEHSKCVRATFAKGVWTGPSVASAEVRSRPLPIWWCPIIASDMLGLWAFLTLSACLLVSAEEEDGPKLSWKDDDGLEIKIIRPIKPEKCKVKSQAGDVVDQFYKLSDKDGNEIGSNFGKKPYVFTLGASQVIPGMDRAMTGMCIGEKRKVVIPSELGFGREGRERDAIQGGQTLYYTVQLVDLFRPVPGPSWTDDDGLKIEVTHKIEEDKCIKAEPGDTIHQHYTLHLEDGTFVDSSFSRNAPFIFKLGTTPRQVIEGMDRAMTGMCEGERRKLQIPSDLGYGDEGRPPAIPGKATLYFDIELHKLIKRDEL